MSERPKLAEAMNAMMSVSHRLFAAALADHHAGVRRSAVRSGKAAVIELARHDAGPASLKGQPLPSVATVPRAVRFDSRLHA